MHHQRKNSLYWFFLVSYRPRNTNRKLHIILNRLFGVNQIIQIIIPGKVDVNSRGQLRLRPIIIWYLRCFRLLKMNIMLISCFRINCSAWKSHIIKFIIIITFLKTGFSKIINNWNAGTLFRFIHFRRFKMRFIVVETFI